MDQSRSASARPSQKIDGRMDLAIACDAWPENRTGKHQIFFANEVFWHRKTRREKKLLSIIKMQINEDTGVQLTFNDVRLRATRAAQNLQNRGYKSRELFCFLAENTDDLLPIYLASIGLACITVPLHSMLTKNEIVPILMKIQPIVIFCDTTSWEQLNAALTEIQSNPKVFIIGDRVDGVESVENLFAETDDECNFV